jgi:ribonuclease HI
MVASGRRYGPGMVLVVYTDGACRGNPGPGGWAWAIDDEHYASGFAAHTTNQRMELMAALEAIRANPEPVEINSDSTYVVNCFRDKWYVGWKKRGWKNSQRQPVANRDLWEPLVDLVLERGDVQWQWVKGHSGNWGNDLVDRLAVEASTRGSGVVLDVAAPSPELAVGPIDEPQRLF